MIENDLINSNLSAPLRLSLNAGAGTFQNLPQNDPTPSVKLHSYFETNNTSLTEITNFDDAVNGHQLTVLVNDENTVFIDGSGLILQGAADWTPSPNDIIEFVFDGTNWIETNRSNNN